jgi:hypothetical protein
MKEVLDHSYPQSCPIEEDARSIARGSFMVTVTNIIYLGKWQDKGNGQPNWLQAGLSFMEKRITSLAT